MPPKKGQKQAAQKEQLEKVEKKPHSDDPEPQKKAKLDEPQQQQKLVQKKLKVLNKEGEVVAKPQLTQMKFETGDGQFAKNAVSISSWNVNGLRAVIQKEDFLKYFKTSKFDIICLNETKIDEETYLKSGLANRFPGEYFQYFNCCKPPKSGYSGVAIFTKVKPISVRHDLGVPKHDAEGRTLTLEFDRFFLVSCYVPNAGQKLDRLAYRTKEWDTDFKTFLNGLRAQKPTILCGDLNVAHHEIDIANPKGNEKSAGFTPQERQGFTQLLSEGWVDSFRHLHPNQQKFSYFSARSNARATNKGWRLDYFVIDDAHKDAITSSDINNLINGSDHTPIEIELALDRL